MCVRACECVYVRACVRVSAFVRLCVWTNALHHKEIPALTLKLANRISTPRTRTYTWHTLAPTPKCVPPVHERVLEGAVHPDALAHRGLGWGGGICVVGVVMVYVCVCVFCVWDGGGDNDGNLLTVPPIMHT